MGYGDGCQWWLGWAVDDIDLPQLRMGDEAKYRRIEKEIYIFV